MTISNDFPILDGVAPSFADVIVRATLSGQPLLDIKDIKSINTGTSMEIGEQRGASGGRIMRRTTGSVKPECSMTLYRSGFQKFLRALVVQAPTARGNQRVVSLVHFGIQIFHTPPGDVEIYEYRIKGCRYTGRTMNTAEGTDADTVDVALNTIEIVDIIDGQEVTLL